MFLHQPKSDVFPDGERIEQRAFLEDNSDVSPQFEESFFAHRGYILAEHVNSAAIRFHQTHGQFKDGAFTRACDAKDCLGFTAVELKRDSVQDGVTFECDGDVFKDNHR